MPGGYGGCFERLVFERLVQLIQELAQQAHALKCR